MEFEDKLDYLTEHTQGVINNYVRDLIKEYCSLKDKLEDMEFEKEKIEEELENWKDNAYYPSISEQLGIPEFGPID